MTTHHLLGLIAQQLLKSVSKLRKQKVVGFAAFSAGKRHAEALQANVISAKRLAELHPLHAALRRRPESGLCHGGATHRAS